MFIYLSTKIANSFRQHECKILQLTYTRPRPSALYPAQGVTDALFQLCIYKNNPASTCTHTHIHPSIYTKINKCNTQGISRVYGLSRVKFLFLKTTPAPTTPTITTTAQQLYVHVASKLIQIMAMYNYTRIHHTHAEINPLDISHVPLYSYRKNLHKKEKQV